MKKFYFFMMMLVCGIANAVAQTPITAPEDVKPGKIYWFDNLYLSTYGPSTLYYSASDGYTDKLWSSYVWDVANDPSDPNQQFAFVEFEGQLYFYSIGAEKFVSWDNDGAALDDIPTSFVTISANTMGNADYPWNIAFDGEKLIGQYPVDGYDYSGYLYCSGSNPANKIYAWQIHEVGDLENADELTEKLANAMTEGAALHQQAADSLEVLWEQMDIFLSEIDYQESGGEKIELQVTEPDAGNYIWCNEPEQSEGPITDLIDGNTATFFHSRWNNPTESQHYLQVDLSEPLSAFSFSYITRVFDGTNDFPDAIEVLGSNDGFEFTSIATFNEKLPQQTGTLWESGQVNANEAYSSLRFMVTAERLYFHMSEFMLYNPLVIEVIEEYQPHAKYVRELYLLTAEAYEMYINNSEYKTDEINAMIEEINALYNLVTGLVNKEEDPLTIELIAEAEELYAIEGVGYPGETPRATFKAVIDAAKANPITQARLDLQEAMDKYITSEDITLPTDGTKYTLTFVTYAGRRNFLDYTADDDTYSLSMVKDTLTQEGLSYPETAVFTCEDNLDGTYSFRTYDDKYLTTPWSGAASGSAAGITDDKVSFTVVKMYPNAKCEADVTYASLFGLVALSNGGTFMAPNSSGSTFYTGNLPHFMGSWTSAMAIEEYVPAVPEGIEAVTGNDTTEGIYDLMGRKVSNPQKGIYIVNGKKVLVK